jgi:RNA polymerase sigma factor (sigma-70 family)
MKTSIEEQLLASREKFLGYVQSKVSDLALAEDILQDSFLKALRKAPELRDEERLVAWFYRILNNAIIDVYRRRGLESRHRAEVGDGWAPSMEAEEVSAVCECLYDLLPSLKPEYGEIIRSELAEEESGEAVSRLGISGGNLKVRRHRARQELRKRLEETCRMCAEHGCLDCACKIRRE